MFWFVNIIFFPQYLQITFQTCENILGKFQGRTLSSVDVYNMRKDKFRQERQDNDGIKHVFCFGTNSLYVDDVFRSSAIEWNAKDN